MSQKSRPLEKCDLESRITDALPSAKAPQKLLPQILSSESPDLQNLFVLSAAHGPAESYKLIADAIFGHAEKHYGTIERAITVAIYEHQNSIVEDLLKRILHSLDSSSRDNILHCALTSAVLKNNIDIAKCILREDLSANILDIPLQIACSRNYDSLVVPMVKSLMKEKRDRNNFQVKCRRVLKSSLQKAIKKKSHSTVKVLLPPYLKCIPYSINSEDSYWASNILEKIGVRVYASISRQQCFELLSCNISGEAKRKILRRLRLNEKSERKDVHLSIEGKTFKAHKDVLGYWSPYFSGLFRHEWRDRDNVNFNENEFISAATLRAVIDFVYCGKYVYKGPEVSKEQALDDLLQSAKYFLIDSLVQQVKDYKRSTALA